MPVPPPFSSPPWFADRSLEYATHPIASGEEVDLLVVGGGFLGLSTALHAGEAGLSVRLVEAARIGSGASGLNG